MGRNAEASGSASIKNVAAIYAYSKTRGLFAGVSLEGSVIVTRGDANEKLYGRRVSAKELLDGSISPPPEADALYRALNAKFHTLGNHTHTNYQHAIENGSSSSPSSSPSSASKYKSTNISAPGAIQRPPPIRQPVGYGAPSLPLPSSPYNTPDNGTANIGHGNTQDANQYSSAGPPSYSTPHTQQPQSNFKRPPPPPPPVSRKPVLSPPSEPTARAVYAFSGEQDGDLSFSENDIITILQKSDSQDDWWTGKVGSRQGIVSREVLVKSVMTQRFSSSFLQIMYSSNEEHCCIDFIDLICRPHLPSLCLCE